MGAFSVQVPTGEDYQNDAYWQGMDGWMDVQDDGSQLLRTGALNQDDKPYG